MAVQKKWEPDLILKLQEHKEFTQSLELLFMFFQVTQPKS